MILFSFFIRLLSVVKTALVQAILGERQYGGKR